MSKKKKRTKATVPRTAKSTGPSAAKQTERKGGIPVPAVAIVIVLILLLIWVAVSARKRAAKAPELPAKIGDKQYASAPPMLIDINKQYTATVKMAKGGEFVIQLYADKAPITVNSFVFLAGQGYFDGVTFHRVLEGFMAQGGDPTGTGSGGPGYQFVNESSDLTFDKEGVVAMANAGRDTNGSQFFIAFAPVHRLDGGYTIFGQVVSGMDVVNGIRRRDPEANPTYAGDAIASITIHEE